MSIIVESCLAVGVLCNAISIFLISKRLRKVENSKGIRLDDLKRADQLQHFLDKSRIVSNPFNVFSDECN